MRNLDENTRTYPFPSRIAKIGSDLVLTARDFFVILTETDIQKIKEIVIKNSIIDGSDINFSKKLFGFSTTRIG